jgi:TonB-linked SusC/RagA family outer membrane protein
MKLKVDKVSRWILMLLAVAMCNMAIAQTIKGVVTDAESGEALIGANVLVVGTSTGTVTDFDGTYSLDLPADAKQLEFSYTGYASQIIDLNGQTMIDIKMSAGELLDEVVVVGYGSQKEKEITSAVTSVDAEEFNQGPITDPTQLLQGKVAGLQVYNRGGDPNGESTVRLRGVSTVGANTEPLVVVDGIIGASLDNVDPNDIESITVLKDGSAAAIYGSRGSSGVILVTTRTGSDTGGVQFTYNGQTALSTRFNSVDIMSPDEFTAAGGTNLGSQTDWIDEVTRTGVSNVHSLAASGGSGNTTFRVSGNYRNVDGILLNSGFEQFNGRLNLSTKMLNDKVSLDFNSSFTNRNSDYGFNEALRYATLYNPTAPIFGADAPFAFNSAQYGGYFETLGLFDSFNPVALAEQNRNDGRRNEVTYGARANYKISNNFSLTGRLARQTTTLRNQEYYPVTSLFRGNAVSLVRRGRADIYNEIRDFNLYEAYGTYINSFGKADLTFTAGYSYQQNNFESSTIQAGDFPDDSKDFSNLLEASQDLQEAGFIDLQSDVSPDEKIIAFFGRANVTIDNAIFLNASVRREGSTKLGAENQWGIFPAFGVGVDLNNYLALNNVDNFKVRVGYGVTGALPRDNGLSQPQRVIVNDAAGNVSTELNRAANPDLKWEEKAELNFGVELGMGRFNATLDLYNRDISDFILERTVDPAVFGTNRRFENSGLLNTQGIEATLNYDVINNENMIWNTGLIVSTYRTTLEEYVVDQEVRANLGAPGQNGTNMILVREGEEIGQIWGPVFDDVNGEGAPTFVDVNGDGQVIAAQDQALNPDADFQVLGNGIPDVEFGWTNQIAIGDWSVNAFFRGALGHSLVNTFRAFYEPRIASQSSYNFVNTELAVPGLTTAQFSDLYVEEADFFKLDNLTISRRFTFDNSKYVRGMTLSLTGQNLFILTNYTGADPEPALTDAGTADNGGEPANIDNPDVLSPGIDRRNNYFASRTFTLGLNLNF